MFAGMTFCQEIIENIEPKDSDVREMWLRDSGASSHITNSTYGMKNKQKCKVQVTVSTGETTVATVKGDIEMISEIGEKFRLKDVLYVPSVRRNLLSTNKFTNEGCTMIANREKMQIQHQNHTITLPMLHDGGKNMYCVKVKRIFGTEECSYETDSTELKLPTYMDINTAHGYCHLGERLLKTTFCELGVKLTGMLKACDGCCCANAKAKGVNKFSTTVATEIGERLFVDTSGPYPATESGNKYWVCLVDDKTRKSWSKFRNTKGDLAKIVEEHVEYLKGMGHTVKYLRCDNAGEHQVKLQKVCEKFGVQLEYTALYTPQMNGVVERRIAVLLGGARAIMFSANLADNAKKKLWAEAVSYMEDTRNSMSTTKIRKVQTNYFMERILLFYVTW